MTPELREKLIAFGVSSNPFNSHNHFRITDVDDGTSVVEAELCRDSLNSWNTPHGGLLFAMADVACGTATVSLRQEQCVTASASIDYIAAAGGEGRLRAEGRVLHCGGRLCYCAAEVRDERGTLLARLNTTMYFTGRKLAL
jgi:uncharacterized protein (TIGR00369 family)